MAEPAPDSAAGAGPQAAHAPVPWATVGGFAATRVLGNLFVRFPYVFITRISRGLGVDVDTLTLVLGLRELGGVAAPLSGRWVDRGHTARVIGWGGIVAGLTCAAASTSHFVLFAAVMVIGGAAKISVDLAQNAWVGHRVAIERRGRVIGIVEMTWAGAFLAGIPLLGLAVDRWGWQAAFWTTGPALAVAAAISALRLPPEVPPPAQPVPCSTDGSDGASTLHRTGEGADDRADVADLARRRRLRTAVWTFAAMQPTAQMLIFAVNSDWFVRELGMTTAGLGAATALLGVAELVGTSIAVLVTDRFGPLRVGGWGMVLTIPPLLAVWGVGTGVVAGVTLLVLADIAIEVGFVAVLPLFSELDTDNRGKAVGHVFVLIMVSRAIASAVAGYVYNWGGFAASVTLAAIACAIAAAAVTSARRRGDAR